MIEKILVGFTCSVLMIALAIGAIDSHSEPHGDVQAIFSGLGLGPSITMDVCPFSYDRRLADACQQQFGPLPCGKPFCRGHVFSVLPLPGSVNGQDTHLSQSSSSTGEDR